MSSILSYLVPDIRRDSGRYPIDHDAHHSGRSPMYAHLLDDVRSPCHDARIEFLDDFRSAMYADISNVCPDFGRCPIPDELLYAAESTIWMMSDLKCMLIFKTISDSRLMLTLD